jgi:DNA-binding response OmpR family regulator
MDAGSTAMKARHEIPTVLIVDDYPTLAELVEWRLRVAGMLTRICPGGAEAMRVVREERVDLVILDVMMPEVDGYEVIRLIRDQEHTRQLPVIMLTACSTEAEIAEAMALGADYYITKPFNAVELVRQVKRLLEERPAA